MDLKSLDSPTLMLLSHHQCVFKRDGLLGEGILGIVCSKDRVCGHKHGEVGRGVGEGGGEAGGGDGVNKRSVACVQQTGE